MSSYGIIPHEPINAGVLARMKPADCKVYQVICAHATVKTWAAWPGVDKMAKLAGLTERAVYKAIARLLSLGMIVVEHGGGRANLNKYLLTGNPERPFTLLEPANPERPFTLSATNPERAIHKTLNGRSVHIRNEDILKRGGAAAPPVADKKPSDSNGAAGRVMAAWCEGFKGRTGNAVAQGAKGRLAGTIKRLVKDFSVADLSGAVSAWFARDRGDYGVELFEKKLQGADRDLRPRPEQSPPRDEYSERKLAELRGQRP